MKTIRKTRLGIWQNLLGKDVEISFLDTKSNRKFTYPIDEFHEFLSLPEGKHKERLFDTESWKKHGFYHWPSPPKRFSAFLDVFEVKTFVKNESKSLQKLRNFYAKNREIVKNHAFVAFPAIKMIGGPHDHERWCVAKPLCFGSFQIP